MSITCRQYEITTHGFDAMILIKKQLVPIHVDLKEKPEKNRAEFPLTINCESLINCQFPNKLFPYKVEDDIFAFLELRIELFIPILNAFLKRPGADQRITYNRTKETPLVIEYSVRNPSPITVPDHPYIKSFISRCQYEVEVEIPFQETKGGSYPKNKAAVKSALHDFEKIMLLIHNTQTQSISKTA